MALVLADRVKETTSTTGTTDFVLSGADTGFQTFSAGVGANNTTYYAVALGSDWEIGLGTLSSDGLTLARTTVLQSSNSDTKVSFAAGAKYVFVTYPADKSVLTDATQTLTNKTLNSPTFVTPVLGTPSSGTVTNLTGTASININGTVGATTANTGSFTTITSSSDVTHNGGTANGVTYLNGSKVLTSGSALTFDGTKVEVSNGTFRASNTSGWYTNLTATGLTNSGTTMDFDSVSSYLFKIATAEQMRLTTTGLGIGTSSPTDTGAYGKALDVQGSGGSAVYVRSTTTPSTNYGYIGFTGGAGNLDIWNNPAGNIRFYNNGSERARITSAGDFLIGSTSTRASSKLDVRGDVMTLGSSALYYATIDYNAGSGLLSIAAESGGGITFKSGTTERARIDTSGNLLVGATSQPAFFSAAAKMYVEMSGSDYITAFRSTNASPSGMAISYSTTPNAASNYFIDARDNTAQRFAVKSNGGIDNYSGNNTNLSDRREKTNFSPATSYLDKICAIPVQTFNYIDQNMEDDGGLTLGVVAQDVQAVAPELVMESNWAKEGDDPKMRLSIYQTDLQYALMKALQELNTKFEAYKASHP